MFKRQFIRLFSIILLAVLVLNTAPLTGALEWLPAALATTGQQDIPEAFSLEDAQLGEERTSGLWHYALREADGYAVITGYEGTETDVTVPAMLDGIDVVGVASNALAGRQRVVLHGNILNIAEDAFGDTKPLIISLNGTFGLYWASVHGCSHETGRDYDLVPGVIDYTDTQPGRVQKRGEDYVAFDSLEAKRLSVGSLFWMKDARGMEFFYRITNLSERNGQILAAVEIPEKVSDAIINYETTVEVVLTEDDFIPADGTIIEQTSSTSKTIATDSQTKETTFSQSISGKTKPFGNNGSSSWNWIGSFSVTVSNTVIYTVKITDSEVTATELTKKQSYKKSVSVSCKGATDLMKEYDVAEEILKKASEGNKLTNEEKTKASSLLGLSFSLGDDTTSGGVSADDAKKIADYLALIQKYKNEGLANSHIDADVKFGTFTLQSPYFNVTFDIGGNVSIEGSITYTETNTNITKEHYDFAKDEWVIDYSNGNQSSDENEKSIKAEIKGKIAVSVEISVGAFFFKNLSIKLELGVEASISKTIAIDTNVDNGLNPALLFKCSVLKVDPYMSISAYVGVWVGKSTGVKYEIYNKKWTAQDLLGKEHLMHLHINAALPDQKTHLPENCPFETMRTISYETKVNTLVQSKKALTGDTLTRTFNIDMNQLVSGSLNGAFLGWAWDAQDTTPTAAAVGGEFINPDGTNNPIIINANLTLYAVWSNAFIVHFNSNGGSVVEDQHIPENGYVTRPPKPTKDGSILLGWYDNNGQEWDFERDQVTSEMTLTAHWDSGEEETGGTAYPFYIGDYSDVSDDCKFNPYYGGQSAASYFVYQEKDYGDGYYGIEITGIQNNPVHLVVPKYLPSYTLGREPNLKVMNITTYAFRGNTSLKSVHFLTDSSIKLTTDEMFKNCTNLEYVDMPYLEYGLIGNSMFSGCINLKCIKVKNGLKAVGNNAFSKTAIRSFNSLSGIVEIGDYAFSECKNLNSLLLGDSIKTIGNFAFYESGITNIYIPDSIDSIGKGFVSRCGNLEYINIGGFDEINNSDMFYNTGGLSNLKEIRIRGNVKRVGDKVFEGVAYALSSANLIIEEGVQEIGEDSFSYNNGLAFVSLPSSLTSIGESAFLCCENLRSIQFDFRNLRSIGDGAFYLCPANFELNLSGTRIGRNAFQDCPGITKVAISNTAAVEQFAFKGCTGLKEVTLNNVESVDWNAFYGCSELKKLILNDVQSIGSGAFGGCAGLEFLDLGNIQDIGPNAFSDCTGLTAVSLQNVKFINSDAFSSCSELRYLDLENVETLADGVFRDCIGLTTVSLTNVKSIGREAFSGCSELRYLDLGNKLTSIGLGAFKNCSKLESLYLPDSLIELSVYPSKMTYSPIYGCTELKYVSIGGIEELKQGFFVNTDAGAQKKLENITIRGSVKRIGGYAFSTNSWNGNESPADVIIEEGVEEIGNYTFAKCSNFISISLPSTIRSIGCDAFYKCSKAAFHLNAENQYVQTYLEYEFIPYQIGTDAEYRLTLVANGGTVNGLETQETLVAWQSALSLPEPMWEGHVFKGWYQDEALMKRWGLDTMPPYNLTLYAAWMPVSDNVIYRTEGNYAIMTGYRLLKEENDTIYLPDTVDHLPLIGIDAGAFAYSDVKKVFIPSSVTNITIGAFSGSDSLKAIHVSAANPVYKSIDGVVYSKDGTRLLFCPPVGVKHVNVPSGVTEIGEYAFDGTALSSVYLPETVATIGERAFQDTDIYQMTLPAYLECIGERAFSGCENLVTIEAEGSPSEIGEYVFSGCNPFMLVYGPNEDCALRTAIRNSGYMYNAYTLTMNYAGKTRTAFLQAGDSMLLPEKPDMGENKQFTGWFIDECLETAWEGMTMPAYDLNLWGGSSDIFTYDIVTDENGAASIRITGCQAIDTEANIPASIGSTPVTAISANSFSAHYTAISIPTSVTEIEEYAFAENAVLICVPGSYAETWANNHHRKTEEKAFMLNWNTNYEIELASCQLHSGDAISLPSLVRSGYDFTGWFWDASLTESAEDAVMPAHDAVLYAGWSVTDSTLSSLISKLTWEDNDGEITITGYLGTEASLTIPAEIHGKAVTAVSDNAFAYNNSLVTVVLPDSISVLGSRTFYSMRALQNVTLSTGLQSIPTGAFAGCLALRQITLPEGIQTIEANAFEHTALTSITLPASLTTIHATALMSCADLEAVFVEEGNAFYESRDGVLYDKVDGVLVKYPAAKAGSSYTITNAWSVGAWAFHGADHLNQIILDEDIYSLGEGAFAQCTGLASMPELGAMVTRIPDQCFYGCARLTEATIPSSIKQIGSRAFTNTGITALIIPDNVTSIGAQAVNSSVLLRGSSGCYARTWAQDNNIAFLALDKVLVESLSFETEEIRINRGQKINLVLNVYPMDASREGIDFYTGDNSIVQVDENGTLYGIGSGSTLIYASAPGGAITICTAVVEVGVEQIQLNAEKTSLTVGESLTLQAIITPETASIQTLAWSGTPGVVFVDENGQVTAIGAGTAIICASASNGVSTEYTLTVQNPSGTFILPAALYELQEEAFEGNAMTYIVIPSGCRSIPKRAFAECESLRIIRLPDTITSIAKDAFQDCGELMIIAPLNSEAQRFAEVNNYIFIPTN